MLRFSVTRRFSSVGRRRASLRIALNAASSVACAVRGDQARQLLSAQIDSLEMLMMLAPPLPFRHMKAYEKASSAGVEAAVSAPAETAGVCNTAPPCASESSTMRCEETVSAE
jgi:hypothetical protein